MEANQLGVIPKEAGGLIEGSWIDTMRTLIKPVIPHDHAHAQSCTPLRNNLTGCTAEKTDFTKIAPPSH